MTTITMSRPCASSQGRRRCSKGHHTCGALRTMRSTQRTPHIVRRLVLGVQHATCSMQNAAYSMPPALSQQQRCGHKHNCQQRGSRTAVERAMLPPLNETDPPYSITTPPFCTPPPHSASGPDRPPPATRTSRVEVSEIATDSNMTAPLRIASTPPSCTPVSMQTRSSCESPACCAALSAIESASTPRRSAGNLRLQAYRASLDARATSLHANKHSKHSGDRPTSAGMGWCTHTVEE